MTSSKFRPITAPNRSSSPPLLRHRQMISPNGLTSADLNGLPGQRLQACNCNLPKISQKWVNLPGVPPSRSGPPPADWAPFGGLIKIVCVSTTSAAARRRSVTSKPPPQLVGLGNTLRMYYNRGCCLLIPLKASRPVKMSVIECYTFS
ncbi:hypothetical protein TcasGA2_TC008155 [Tribolium castaneum]|uniref:Uncharacterized protein n=1 Tax=Tribolium castaneum TaxID=7070 RepID=D2A045_TRICA|nr:hypothetical protein TcasGA2_TC008155 [Tribolium castaneum]